MITHILLKGVLKLVQIRKEKNHNVARIFNPKSVVPEDIFNEIAPNCYEDSINGDLYKLLDGKMVSM